MGIELRYKGLTEYGTDLEVLKCTLCNKTLVKIYSSGGAYAVSSINDCKHYKWYSVGNHCYNYCSLECHPTCAEVIAPLIAKKVFVVKEGTTYWLLVPR